MFSVFSGNSLSFGVHSFCLFPLLLPTLRLCHTTLHFLLFCFLVFNYLFSYWALLLVQFFFPLHNLHTPLFLLLRSSVRVIRRSVAMRCGCCRRTMSYQSSFSLFPSSSLFLAVFSDVCALGQLRLPIAGAIEQVKCAHRREKEVWYSSSHFELWGLCLPIFCTPSRVGTTADKKYKRKSHVCAHLRKQIGWR